MDNSNWNLKYFRVRSRPTCSLVGRGRNTSISKWVSVAPWCHACNSDLSLLLPDVTALSSDSRNWFTPTQSVLIQKICVFCMKIDKSIFFVDLKTIENPKTIKIWIHFIFDLFKKQKEKQHQPDDLSIPSRMHSLNHITWSASLIKKSDRWNVVKWLDIFWLTQRV